MPLPFAAGEPAKVFRLGMLSLTPPGPGIRALERRLQTLGWEEGRNLQIDFVRLDDTDTNRSLAMAAELVARGVDTIYASGPELAVKLAVTATRTVPVVMVANDYDPVAREKHQASTRSRATMSRQLSTVTRPVSPVIT
jgi:hypothetical protein